MVQLSYPYMTTGKIIALIILIFFSKLTRLLLKHLYMFVIVFLQKSKHLLISWLQSSSVVISEPPKIKSDTVSIVSPSICHEVMGPDALLTSQFQKFICWNSSSKSYRGSPSNPIPGTRSVPTLSVIAVSLLDTACFRLSYLDVCDITQMVLFSHPLVNPFYVFLHLPAFLRIGS